MRTLTIREAKSQLSRLVDAAGKGESFLISRSGTPVVKVSAYHPSGGCNSNKLGFLAGQFSIPEDFDSMGSSEIERVFGVDD